MGPFNDYVVSALADDEVIGRLKMTDEDSFTLDGKGGGR